MNQTLYFDNSMATKPSERAIAKMMPHFSQVWGNPMSPHSKGQENQPYLEESYKALYDLVRATPQDLILFTSSGAEAVNTVFQSTYHEVTLNTGKNQFLASEIDEAPALMAMSRLEKANCVGKLIQPSPHCTITVDAIADVITPRTALLSLSWANGLTGVVNPVSHIASLCKDRGILLHLDASHVLGKLFFELEDVGADFISWSGEVLHAPLGTGALYVRKGVHLDPFVVGGLEQGGYRAGAFSVAGLSALGEASRELIEARDYMCTEIARLRNKLEDGVQALVPDAKALFTDQQRVPHISAIAFPGIINEALLYALNRRHLCACIGGGSFQQIGLVLKACGFDDLTAHSAVSFSLSRETTDSQVDQAILIISEAVSQLRNISQSFRDAP